MRCPAGQNPGVFAALDPRLHAGIPLGYARGTRTDLFSTAGYEISIKLSFKEH
jgi:hypothetical protein